MKAIQNIDDIKVFVDEFYLKVRQDDLLGPIFESRIQDWPQHLRKMYNFWNAVLFQARDYNGNPFAHHVTLPVDLEHFERWIELFYETLDEHFTGEVVQHAKVRAAAIANTFYSKMRELERQRRAESF